MQLVGTILEVVGDIRNGRAMEQQGLGFPYRTQKSASDNLPTLSCPLSAASNHFFQFLWMGNRLFPHSH